MGSSHSGPSSAGSASPVLRFNDRHTADFTVVSENQEIYVHRSIMMSQSPFLRRFLTEDPTCTRINANNAKHAAMKAVLGALYIIPLDLSSYTPELRVSIVQQALKLHDSTTAPSSRAPSVNASPSSGGGDAPPPLQPFSGWDSHAANFDIVLSAWEIGLHFQLAHVAHYVMSQLLLPLLDRRNVVRCLKGALKHQQSSPDAQAVLEWCTDNKLLPPDLDTPETIATWETLCNKYPYLRDIGNASQIGDDALLNASSAVSAPSVERERPEHHHLPADSTPFANSPAAFGNDPHFHNNSNNSIGYQHQQQHQHHALLTNVYRQSSSHSTTPYVTVLHSRSPSAEDVTNARNYFQPMHHQQTSGAASLSATPRALPQSNNAIHFDDLSTAPFGVPFVAGKSSRSVTPHRSDDTIAGAHQATTEAMSPQRQQMIYLSDRAQRHIHEEVAAQQQAAADEALMEQLAQERELLHIEEAEFQQQSERWKADIAHLSSLLEDLEKEDLDVVDAYEELNKVEAQLKGAEAHLEELHRSRVETEEALKENEEYLKNTTGYLPAAAAAERELSAKLDEITMWANHHIPAGAVSPVNPATGVQLRQLLAEYAATLRKEKDEALRSLESEARIEDALRQHIHSERSSAMHLQSMLDAHAASLAER